MEERLLAALEAKRPGDLVADRPDRVAGPDARPSPTLSQSSPSACGAATVSFAARGPCGSKSVNHSEPVGGAARRLWTV